MDLAGVGVGLAMAIPGGLFEIAAGAYLLVKGFGGGPPDRADSTHAGQIHDGLVKDSTITSVRVPLAVGAATGREPERR